LIAFLKAFGGFGAINALRALIPFMLLPLLTRWLLPGDFGVLSVFEVTILILTPIIMCNSHTLVSTRYFQVDAVERAEYVSNSILIGAILFAVAQGVILLGGEKFAGIFGLSGRFFLWIPAFAATRALAMFISNILQLQQRILLFGVYTLLGVLLDIGLSYALVVEWRYGFKGRLFGAHAALLLAAILVLRILWREGGIKLRWVRSRIREIVSFGVPLVPHALGGVSLALADRYLIANRFGMDSLGMYAAAYQVAAVMLLVGTSLNQVWSPWLFHLLSTGVSAHAAQIKRQLIINLLVICVAALAIYAASDILFLIFISPSFYLAKQYFPWLLVGFLFQSLYFMFVNFEFYDQKAAAVGVVTFSAATANILLNLLLLPNYGVMGAAYATAGSMALYLALVMARLLLTNKSFAELRKCW
jgi:O-antigen/teichoic acid export membrane protein